MRKTPDHISKLKQSARQQILEWEEEVLHLQGKLAYAKTLGSNDPEIGTRLRFVHEQLRQLRGRMEELQKQSKRRFF